MHNIWTEINQKKFKSTSVTIFQDKSEKKIYSFTYFVEYYFSWKLQGLTPKASVAFPPVNVEILVEENVYLKDYSCSAFP